MLTIPPPAACCLTHYSCRVTASRQEMRACQIEESFGRFCIFLKERSLCEVISLSCTVARKLNYLPIPGFHENCSQCVQTYISPIYPLRPEVSSCLMQSPQSLCLLIWLQNIVLYACRLLLPGSWFHLTLCGSQRRGVKVTGIVARRSRRSIRTCMGATEGWQQ